MHSRWRRTARGVAAAAVIAGLGSVVTHAQQPDFTGVWTTYTEPAPAQGRAAGAGGGGRGAGPALPLTAEAQKKIADYQTLIQGTGDTPGGYCLGTGMPGSMLGSGGYPMEIIQRSNQITIIYEAHNEVRRVYLADRIVPEADRLPGRNGHSTARWEGDTLVIETTNLIEQVDQRYAHSDKAKIVERYRMTKGAKGERVLVAEMTMTDPVFYKEPVKAEKNGRKFPMAISFHMSAPRKPGTFIWNSWQRKRAKSSFRLQAEGHIRSDAMKKSGLVVVAALVLLWGAGISAHHSAQQFDFTKTASMTGVVKKFQAINPHMRLVLAVTDAKGTREVAFEGHSTNNMYRAGYRDGMIKLGDKITVFVAPLRDGSEGGYVTAATTADGKRFGVQSRAEQEAERAKAEGRK